MSNCQRIGIEDLTVTRNSSINQGDDQDAGEGCNIFIQNSSDCWISGVCSYLPKARHIELSGGENGQTVRNITITGCTFNEAQAYGTNGQGYGVNFNGAYGCRLENSLFHFLRHAISFQQDASFNVVAYNASFIRMQDEDSNPDGKDEDTGGSIGDLSFHGRYRTTPGPHHNLLEGNRIELVNFDRVHGSNGPYNTFFRNYIDESFDVSDYCFGTCEGDPPYPYSNHDQNAQNVIGCWGLSREDLSDLTGGTEEFCGHQTDYDPNQMDNCAKSYYSYYKPDYLPDVAWPFIPRSGATGLNAAELRKGNYGAGTVYPHGWKNYICGPFLAKHLILTNGQQLSNSEYKAKETITLGPATIKAGNPVYVTASESITFGPGFSTEPGVDFTAEITDVSCGAFRNANESNHPIPIALEYPSPLSTATTNEENTSMSVSSEYPETTT